jgi:dTDP-4-amino-4,6-dideoxygalactose transaminase
MKMSRRMYSRREFVKKNSLAGLGAAVAIGSAPTLLTGATASVPALLGGEPVRTKPWPEWPMWIPEKDEPLLLKSIRSGVWSRAALVTEFEKKWAAAIGTKRCLAVVNGTNAISASLINLGIGGGDEVIVPPYTFIATVIAVIQSGAMPVFADTDQRTFQIDTEKIEAKITPRTKAIVPVHILGLPANMPRILEIAKKHNLLVVEDACQAWLAEINHKKVGSFGNAGAFSFQNSKNMPIGEGGAITSDDDTFMDRCYSYHNYGNPYGTTAGTMSAGTIIPGTKLRMAEYQAAIGLAQMVRLEEQTTNRNENALYLQGKLRKISGIIPYELNKGVTRAAYHLFPFRYKKEQFKGMTRDKFLTALKAEGVPGSSGYTPLNKMPYLEAMMKTKNFQKMYPAELLDYKKYMSQNQCPANDQLCEEAVWFSQNMLLGTKADMDDIVNAIVKVKENAAKLG